MVRLGFIYYCVIFCFRRRFLEEDFVIVIIGIEEGFIFFGDFVFVCYGCFRDWEC